MKRKKNIRRKRFYGISKSCRIVLLVLCILTSAWSCKEDEENSKINLNATKSMIPTISPKGFKIADNPAELKEVLNISGESEITKIEYMENEFSHAAFIYFTQGGVKKNMVLASGKIGFEANSVVLYEGKTLFETSNGASAKISRFQEPTTMRIRCSDCGGCRVQGTMDMQSKKMTFGCSEPCCSLYIAQL